MKKVEFTPEVIHKICQLIRSDDKEMCLLAVTMFTGLTDRYKDYFDIRTLYEPNKIMLDKPNEKMAFNMMFNSLNKEEVVKEYNRQRKLRKRFVGSGMRMISLSSNQLQKLRKQKTARRGIWNSVS